MPSGIAAAATIAKKTRIWAMPLAVMAETSKLFRSRECVNEVHENSEGEDPAENVVEQHVASSHEVAESSVAKKADEHAGTKGQHQNVQHWKTFLISGGYRVHPIRSW